MPKGQEFERELSKQLSLWWTQDLPEPHDAVFWRTSNSGGRATARQRKGQKTRGSFGDIGAIDPIGTPLMDLLVIELKRGYNRETIIDVFDCGAKSKRPTYFSWFTKAEENKRSSGTFSWVLIHRRDTKSAMIWFPSYLRQHIKECVFGKFPTEDTKPVIYVYLNNLCVEGYRLVDFLNQFKPEYFRKLHSKIFPKTA